MILPKAFKWVLRILLIFAITLTLPVVFLGPLWHWKNGDFIYHNQWKILVAPSFFVSNTATGPSLWKLPVGFPLRHDPYAVIGISDLKRPFEYEADYQTFINSTGMVADTQRYQFLREVSIGTKFAHCLEYGLPNNSAKSFAQCTVEHSNLMVSFRGHTKYLPVLVSTIRSMSEQSK
jgi:hypothetical protein